MQKKFIIVLAILVGLGMAYYLGPSPEKPNWPAYRVIPELKEDTGSGIKPGNDTRIIWKRGMGLKTPYVMLYLHGFSACPEEGFPVIADLADSLDINVYAPRLFAHGLKEDEPMLQFNQRDYWISACRALKEAQQYGDSVIIVGTSTGATLALMLANRFPQEVKGLILYSPNIELFDTRSWLLTQPYGLYIARMVKGGKYHQFEGPAGTDIYWTTKYRLEALIELQNMLEHGMQPELFKGIKVPVAMYYYYKSVEEQDEVVSVRAMLSMFEALGTPPSDKMKVALPNVGVHAIPSGIWNQNTSELTNLSLNFIKSRFPDL